MAAGMPCFIDCEASGLGPCSYPVAVAWNLPSGEIHRCLVDPTRVPQWTDWDPAAEAIHGLDRKRLERNGWEPAYIAARLQEDLSAYTVYSDAPVFDQFWIERLFAACDESCPLHLEHVEDLFLAELRRHGEMVYETVLRLQDLQEEVRHHSTGHHDAGYDVGSLIQLWRRIQGLPVKMNHGVGPLPHSSETGTFLPIKLRGR